MKPKFRKQLIILVALALPALALPTLNGCSGRNPAELEQATGEDNPVVFIDEFDGLDYAAFEYSNYDAFTIDEEVAYYSVEDGPYEGMASLHYAIPAEDWAGGSFFSLGARDLGAYNALTFWAKGSRDFTLSSAGFGLGINYPSDYQGEVNNIAITTNWTFIIIPLPNSARMTLEHGLFWISGATGDESVDLWFDEVVFAQVTGITSPRPVMSTRSVQALVGDNFVIPGTRTTFNVNGVDRLVYHTQNHFDYFSSDAAVAKAEENVITAVSLGEATITAKLGNTDVQGVVTTKVVTEITRPEVFIDSVDPGLEYGAFEFSYYDALSIEDNEGVDGSAALKFNIPLGQWAGGAFSTAEARDLSSFNALIMDAKASQAYTLSALGYGIGMSYGGTDYMVEINDIQLTTEWTRIIIPVPNPDRLENENGVWWFSAGNAGDIWFDNIQFANVEDGVIANPRPVMDSDSVNAAIDDVVTIEGTSTTFSVDGVDLHVVHPSVYFDFFSSDESVAVPENGEVTAVGGGTATITAMLIETDVEGEVTVTVSAPPTDPAPTPTPDQADVLSIFSDAYTNNVTVDSWRTDWSSGSVAVSDQQIQGDNVKAYTGLSSAYVGIDFSSDQIDATTPGMTHFTLDVFAPVGSMLAVKLVDFGPDGEYGGPGSDDTEKELIFHAGTTPPFLTGQWVSLDIPLTDFTGMNFGNVAQFVLRSTNIGNLWVDNIYFHK